ncbi:telomerase-binding protein [Diplodia corticola]|uniref:Telomerase-binding protein n=1 Tax=Diplodia corticola TaxID=236234 RepID=A0A1J9R1R4_9PEZI|nr:telomerase-binding protein [Diplodia corticola]OJD34537.1 telomerase-binding protein [Diplodia corticola]
MNTDYFDLHEGLTTTQRAQQKSAALVQPLGDALACPYCPCELFDHDDQLLHHVRTSHAAQIQGSGVREGTPLFRKLLRDEALHKAKQIATAQHQRRVEDQRRQKQARRHDAAARAQTPDLNRLTLQSKLPPACAGFLGAARPPPRKRAGSDFPASESPSRSPVRQDAKSRKARAMDPAVEPQIADVEMAEEYARQLPHRPHSVTPQGPRAQPYNALLLHSQLDPRGIPHRDHGSVSPSSTSNHGSPVPPTLPDPSVALSSTNDQWPELVLQPDSRPISQEQLAAEVKSIYAGLTMVESKCIHVDKAQATAERDPVSGQHPRLAPDHWQALIALHRTLLHEHHDFFLASQHPSASQALRRLAAKYSMPARMWKHGIHSFLELLRHRLPESLEYMLTFIYLAYQMMALLYETVPAFEDTWIECLGDLGRYRMAIEDEDLRDRETWAGVARFWYSKAADKSPAVGRLYHHLAILARPNALQQLYFYCRSLTCVQPFMSARESILTLFDPILGRSSASYSHSSSVETSFIRAHGLLFEKDQAFQQHTFDKTLGDFIGQLDTSIGRVTSKWKEQGAYMAIANIASLFDYGSEGNFLRLAFATQLRHIIREQSEKNDDPDWQSAHAVLPPTQPAPDDMTFDLQTANTFPSACRLTFDTLRIVLQRFGDKNVLTHFHILLAFLNQLATLPYDTTYIFEYVQWEDFAFFLNTIARSETFVAPAIECPNFLHEGEEDFRPLPEDYLIRGQLWAHSYYPATWFNGVVDEEERMLELASTIKSRTERILWLGVRLASKNIGLTYDQASHSWSAHRSGNAMDVDE